jgi:hypothetical protein
MLNQRLSAPILAAILRDRRLALAISGVATLNLALFALHAPTWQCPLLNAFGVPCPGCGLTRAIALLFKGDWRASMTMHAFAPFFLIGLVVIGLGAVLPGRGRQALIGNLQTIEQRTAITTVLLAAFFAYWLVRLLFLQSTFFQLIRG